MVPRQLTVIKLGGALTAAPARLALACRSVGELAARGPVAVVPGGGPFADLVRQVQQDLGASDDAAHWMAILAMDQYAEVLAEKIARAELVHAPDGVNAALSAGRVPVLAPSRWLRQADPLAHSWNVTSDSLAAWIAGELGAERLLLVKMREGDVSELADVSLRVTAGGLDVRCVTPERME